MKQRMNFYEKGFKAMKPLFSLGAYLSRSPVEQSLRDLLHFRVSQINGCAYCLDMHSKDLLAMGETTQRLLVMDAWREAPFYSDRERAALGWAEAVTKLPGGEVPDDVYNAARAVFSEEELVELTMAVIAINTYNRINIAFRVQAGSYKVGEHAITAN